MEKNEFYKMKLLSSLNKVVPWKEPMENKFNLDFTMLQNESFSFQAAYYSNCIARKTAVVKIESSLKEVMSIRKVELIPVGLPSHGVKDEDYLFTQPGLYPDRLAEITNNKINLLSGQWGCIWINLWDKDGLVPGNYEIKITLLEEEGGVLCSAAAQIEILKGMLPEQSLYHTEWFHADCLANYYQVEPWCDKYWSIVRNFLHIYQKRGMNTILTPIFTPPLDTKPGGERTTVQLVKIVKNKEYYTFDFSRLKRWIDLCQQEGIRYFEFMHLFSQWGAKSAPKIIAEINGKKQQIFGWETNALGKEYQSFLKQFLRALTDQLEQWGIQKQVFFHVSDEPGINEILSYQKAHNIVKDALEGYPIIDAVSDFSFYKKGLIKNPVVATDHVESFLQHKVENLWVYYCGAQNSKVANRYISMPSYRNRILGVQLYQYKICGFLHWGFNFYNDMLSMNAINPYAVTDCNGAFPSGDAFLVYPGEEGVPEESIRIMVLEEALQDVRAFKLLEEMTSRNYVEKLIQDESGMKITFSDYPRNHSFLLKLRSKVNRKISEFFV